MNMRCTACLKFDARQIEKNAIYTALICNFCFRFTHTFCRKNYLCTFLSQKEFAHTFFVANTVYAFFLQKRFTHFVRKVFARWKLPSGKFRLFGPLQEGISWYYVVCTVFTSYSVSQLLQFHLWVCCLPACVLRFLRCGCQDPHHQLSKQISVQFCLSTLMYIVCTTYTTHVPTPIWCQAKVGATFS